ncbi:hypothetical protein J2Y67_000478 [Neobacillus niacini]|nr:hypothetical protein [Neobacillus niacini]
MQHLSFYPFSINKLSNGQCNSLPFTLFTKRALIRALQHPSFYLFYEKNTHAGIATPFLLPFLRKEHSSGHCNTLPFTLFTKRALIQVMQLSSSYPFHEKSTHPGIATPFLLPFSRKEHSSGHCNTFPFTLFTKRELIQVMQHPSFYPLIRKEHSSGHCNTFPFTLFTKRALIQVMQRSSFYPFYEKNTHPGIATLFLLPFSRKEHSSGHCNTFPFTFSKKQALIWAMQSLPFTLFTKRTLIRALQHPSFYPFHEKSTHPGNATLFLLPFSRKEHSSGHCNTFPFTFFTKRALIRALQHLSFYPFHEKSTHPGNATLFLLPFLRKEHSSGHCNTLPFTFFYKQPFQWAMQL